MSVNTCTSCGHRHEHPYVWCQACDSEMNPLSAYSGPTLQVPKHFRAANEGGYTMAELRRENDEGFRTRDKIGY